MFKKILSFTVILFSLSLIAFAVWQDSIFSVLLQSSDKTAVNYAYSSDRSGMVYFMRKENNGQFLCAVDSTGSSVLKKNVTEQIEWDSFVDSIYVDNEKNIIITQYGMNPVSGWIEYVRIHMFREDGTYYDEIFNHDLSHYKDGRYKKISSISEDERNIIFGFNNEGTIEEYKLLKGGGEPLTKMAEYTLTAPEQKELTAFCSLPNEGIIINNATGVKIMDGNDVKSVEISDKGIYIENFFYCNGTVYFYDRLSGGIYSNPGYNEDFLLEFAGTRSLTTGDNIPFEKLTNVSVNPSGNITGVYEKLDGASIYMGGATYFTKVAEISNRKEPDLNFWLFFSAVVIGVVILSVLMWDFFTGFMNMKLSILARQTLLIILVLYSALYFTTGYYLIPDISSGMYETQKSKMLSVADIFMSFTKAMSDDMGVKAENLALIVERYGEEYSIDRGILSSETIDRFKTHLFTVDNEGIPRILASNDRYSKGYNLDSLLSGKKISDIEAGVYTESADMTGRKLILVLNTDEVAEGKPVKLCVIGNLTGIDEFLSEIERNIVTFMFVTAILLVVVLTAVEMFSLFNLKKLKKNVEDITGGNYDVEITIKSGDEIEELADSLNDLKNNIRQVTMELKQVNKAYLPFIPERFLEILGRYSMEGINRNLRQYKTGIYILCLYLRFPDNTGMDNAGSNLDAINLILEQVVPVINDNKGTVFNFRYEGFDAVFEDGPDIALSAALKIRDSVKAINEENLLFNDRRVTDVRIVLAKTNAIFGFIGDESRMQPIAVSERLTVTDGIAEICFESDVYIVAIEDFTENLQQNTYQSRRIGNVLVKGKKIELFDIYDSDPYSLLRLKSTFEDTFRVALFCFENGDFEKAKNLFMEIIKFSSEDGISKHYMYLSEHNIRSEAKLDTFTIYS